MPLISIGVVDDHPLFREGVIRSLSEIGQFEIAGEGGTAEAALTIAQRRPDILLLDISMPGGGLGIIAQILQQNPDQKIVMLTASEGSDDIATAIRHGAKGYVVKGVGSRALADILRLVASGKTYISPTIAIEALSRLQSADARPTGSLGNLTVREREILTLVTAGMSNKRVAIQLSLHEKTIKHHMTSIMTKLGVTNRTEAAMAYRDAKDLRKF
jgi:two-component system nitrate/nitrite response regulator NarL